MFSENTQESYENYQNEFLNSEKDEIGNSAVKDKQVKSNKFCPPIILLSADIYHITKYLSIMMLELNFKVMHINSTKVNYMSTIILPTQLI